MNTIAILCGGTSGEREISLKSGANLALWGERAGYRVRLFDFPNECDAFLQTRSEFSSVIPMFHGVGGEDGQMSAFLETLGIRAPGCPHRVHALCIDKHLTDLSLSEIAIHIPKSQLVKQNEKSVPCLIPFPLIVKPNRGGSSLSTKRVTDAKELQEAIDDITDDDILIQECIEGREFTVGITREHGTHIALPIIEIVTRSDTFFDYSEKYETDGSNEVFLEGEEALQHALIRESIRICEHIGTAGVVRLDWRYDGTYLYFLEVNTIPGFTSGSLVPKMWKRAGKSEKDFLEMILGS